MTKESGGVSGPSRLHEAVEDVDDSLRVPPSVSHAGTVARRPSMTRLSCGVVMRPLTLAACRSLGKALTMIGSPGRTDSSDPSPTNCQVG